MVEQEHVEVGSGLKWDHATHNDKVCSAFHGVHSRIYLYDTFNIWNAFRDRVLLEFKIGREYGINTLKIACQYLPKNQDIYLRKTHIMKMLTKNNDQCL